MKKEKEKQVADPRAEKKANWIKTARWIYWTVTLLFVVTMMSAGLTYLAGRLLTEKAEYK